jgi:hypothetical protein
MKVTLKNQCRYSTLLVSSLKATLNGSGGLMSALESNVTETLRLPPAGEEGILVYGRAPSPKGDFRLPVEYRVDISVSAGGTFSQWLYGELAFRSDQRRINVWPSIVGESPTATLRGSRTGLLEGVIHAGQILEQGVKGTVSTRANKRLPIESMTIECVPDVCRPGTMTASRDGRSFEVPFTTSKLEAFHVYRYSIFAESKDNVDWNEVAKLTTISLVP